MGATGKRPRKQRADLLLIERGLADSRTKAQAAIMAGQIYSGERRIEKAGETLAIDAPLEMRGPDHPWVSRGALKLVHGLDHFDIDPAGLNCLDVGASTGGFTEVLLDRGAATVTAVDVGRGQLAWKLREDPRVIVLEGRNARSLTATDFPTPPQLVVCDASFIGLEKVLATPLTLTAQNCALIALIKPQFQLNRDAVGKGGIVRDPARHAEACDFVRNWLDTQDGWVVDGIAESPITGAKGNKEFLIAAHRSEPR
ncbi:MAG: TlyA family RNA methyltransferase [Rhodospirillaceae bacterium]|nr:TlyA family RNA methyltransferase [Rhodospirillaceae bacterium]MDD9918785.1 TlyA family RNA methyltransferase [Rhodospirillaceae bacterium]MDD9928713.1 TlyA family RNA methyltransferase [Rhodospirillaceae bacterium]